MLFKEQFEYIKLELFFESRDVGYDEEFMLYLSSFGKHFSQIRVLAIDILAADERSGIMSRKISCVSFDFSFLSDLQCFTPSQHFASVAV